jgi:integrase
MAWSPGLRAAEVGQLSPHGLRATMVMLALGSGMPLRDVQDSARHADPRTTRRPALSSPSSATSAFLAGYVRRGPDRLPASEW